MRSQPLRTAEGKITVFVLIEARGGNLVSDPGDEEVVGYYQTLGITAGGERELQRLVFDYVRNDLGSELVGIESQWVPDFEGSDADVKDVVGDMTRIGIWYSSGRAFYGPEEEGDGDS